MPEPEPGQSGGPKNSSGIRALWYVATDKAELRPVALPTLPAGWIEVEALWSAVSRGTERLVASGRVPPSEFNGMRCPMQEGDFPFPVKYGYCAVGRVVGGPAEWAGQTVFALHPHQSRFQVPEGLAARVPAGVPPRRAVLAANMETALNALWDSGAGAGDRISVVGAGIVGLLTAFLCARLPGADVTVIDVDPGRAALAAHLGAAFLTPERTSAISGSCDAVFHASASAAGLETALTLAGREASIVEMSWYGEGRVSIPLGGSFHSGRQRIIGSQVGEVSPSRRPRWSHARRLAKALDLLADDRLDALLTLEVAFDDLPRSIADILSPQAPGLTALVRY